MILSCENVTRREAGLGKELSVALFVNEKFASIMNQMN